MKGKVIQFRRGRHTVKNRHFLIEIDSVKKREDAAKLAGSEVTWTSPAGRAIKGKVASAHGNKGVLRVIFEKGLPGQALTTEVDVGGKK